MHLLIIIFVSLGQHSSLLVVFFLFTACLVMISKALERDEEYPKGN